MMLGFLLFVVGLYLLTEVVGGLTRLNQSAKPPTVSPEDMRKPLD